MYDIIAKNTDSAANATLAHIGNLKDTPGSILGFVSRLSHSKVMKLDNVSWCTMDGLWDLIMVSMH